MFNQSLLLDAGFVNVFYIVFRNYFPSDKKLKYRLLNSVSKNVSIKSCDPCEIVLQLQISVIVNKLCT